MNWQTILNIGSLSGLVGLTGGIYLYFENRKFKKLDAEKEYKIACVELAEINEKELQEKNHVDGVILEVIRGSKTRDVFDLNKDYLDKLELKKWKIIERYMLPKAKVEARVSYYEDLKDHSLLWFLKNKRKG